MGIEIARPTEDQLPEAYRVFTTALQVAAPTPEKRERRRQGWFTDRMVVALDGGRIVGTTTNFPFETLLPGGAFVRTAGLTRVGVLPSHRRQGLLASMMARHLREAKERGEVLGSLRASQAAIYGRFGYGLAGLAAHIHVTTNRSAFRTPIELDGRFEVMQGPELIRAAAAAYERCLVRPGALARPRWYWELAFDPHLDADPSIEDWGVVHFDRRNRPDGFARWAALDRDQWESGRAHVLVSDLFGETSAVQAALWRFVFDLDLVEVVTSEIQPVDDPIRHRLVDPRAWKTVDVADEQWIRILDVEAVLGARTYHCDDTMVIEIDRDDALPENVGRYEVGSSGCRRVRRAVDLRLGIAELGAVALGGTTFQTLVAAGRITEVRRGSAARADVMFRVPLAPFCGTYF